MIDFIKYNSLHKVAIGIIVLFVVLQIVLLLHYYNILPVTGDAKLYVSNAIYHADIGMPYPTKLNNYDSYIQSPGYVNFLAFLFYVFGTYRIVLPFKVLFNICIIFEIYSLAKLFFNQATADISAILYCLMPVNIFASINFYNEIDYLFLSLSAFYFCLCKKNIWLVGLAYAHTIRPIEIVLIIGVLIFFAVKKYKIKYYVALFFPYFIFLSLFGIYCKGQTGVFFTTSSVTGHNLIFIANDQSMGGKIITYSYMLSLEKLVTFLI